MIRSLAAVLAGFFFIGVVTLGTDALLQRAVPDAFDANGAATSVGVLAFTIVYLSAYEVIGAWITARLAASHALRHALFLGALVIAFGLYGALADWGAAPPWFHVLVLVLVIPCVWIGGRLGAHALPR